LFAANLLTAFQPINPEVSTKYSRKYLWNKITDFGNLKSVKTKIRQGNRMIYEKIQTADFLTKALTDELFRGARLIERIDDSIYRRKANGTGSIGGHFRHNLDFVQLFLNGMESGEIDYSRRERDEQIEENRLYAVKRFALAMYRLQNISPDFLERKVLIRSEINPGCWLESSAARELEFLHSHTVHHHALISEKLAFFGVRAASDFGVAPSTLKFRERQNVDAQAA
jgi:hypothetical protein